MQPNRTLEIKKTQTRHTSFSIVNRYIADLSFDSIIDLNVTYECK